MKIDSAVIRELVCIGNDPTYESDVLKRFYGKFSHNMFGYTRNDFSGYIVKDLGEIQLSNLIKGIIIFCTIHNISTGGSVSCISWLYDCFRSKYPESEPELCRWIVIKRQNPYEPFGTIYFNNAMSYAEHLDLKSKPKYKVWVQK